MIRTLDWCTEGHGFDFRLGRDMLSIVYFINPALVIGNLRIGGRVKFRLPSLIIPSAVLSPKCLKLSTAKISLYFAQPTIRLVLRKQRNL